jgi:hypothetical protein
LVAAQPQVLVVLLAMRTLLLLILKPNWLILQMVIVRLDISQVLVLACGGFVLPITAIAATLRT